MKSNETLINEHKKEKEESFDFKRRRLEQWRENYLLYRDMVQTNRLTQRQAINLPIMRETIQTWVSKIQEAPELKFKSRGRTVKHKTGEILTEQLWNYYFDKLSLDILDDVDKKVVGLQGRSFKICGISQKEFFIDIIDPYDIELSPRANMLDLNSVQYIIRTHIFKPLREILANSSYDEDAKNQLKMYLDTKEGLIQADETREAFVEKMQRLRDLGAQNFDDYNASELLVEVNESYKLIWHEKENRFVRHLIKFGADKVVLYNKPIKEAIGINRLPIVTWADDPDIADPWCDGKGDSVRTINKAVNMYISSDLENRMYQTFGMSYYNTLNGTFAPRGFEPKPFGMYGVPGNPNELIQRMEIRPLADTSNQIQFLKDMIQNSVAQTPTEQGVSTGGRTTLGEVQINLQQSQGRNSVSAKHYRRAWEEIGEIFYALMSESVTTPIKLYKQGVNGDIYDKTIYPSDWIMPEGYECQVVMKGEAEALDQYSLQKSQYIIANFQDNPVALKLAKRKQLETLGNYTSEEIDQVMQFEDQKMGGNPAQNVGGEEALPKVNNQGGSFNNSQMLQQETQQ